MPTTVIEYRDYYSETVCRFEAVTENATQALHEFRRTDDHSAVESVAFYADNGTQLFTFQPDNTWKYISHVWSSFGHHFYETTAYDDSRHQRWTNESCLRCGAEYRLVRRKSEPTGGDYEAANGDDPVECPDGSHEENPDCNCLFCM